MVKDVGEYLFGEYAERKKEFDNGVLEIEKKNPELFEKKKLSSHYMLKVFQNNSTKVDFTEHTLPPSIEKEVIDLFESLFPKP